jgi:hypothetical protein
MTLCASMPDRMPEVAAGRTSWSEAESAHLAGCADCAAEWALIQTARRLGDQAARGIDPVALTQAVLARLREERTARRRWTRAASFASLAVAAMIAVVLWVRPGPRAPEASPGTVASAAQPLRVPLAELERLDATELEAVLDGLDEPVGAGAAPDAPNLGDLDDHELERVLRSLEG